MASLRTGSGLPVRPSDGIRTRRMGESGPQLNAHRTLAQRETEAENPRKPPQATQQTSGQSRLPSRVPQSSIRRPSLPQSLGRPSFEKQSQSGGSVSTAASSPPKTWLHAGSGSSSSGASFEENSQPTQNVLRRKKSPLSPDISGARIRSRRTSSSSSISQPQQASLDSALGIHLDRGITDSPAEIQVAEVVEIQNATANAPVIYPELDRYRDHRRPTNLSESRIDVPFKLSTHDLPPPTPGSVLFSGTSAASASPSTRFSESPGPGAYSRDTTPTSILSQSPSLAAPFRPKSSKGRHHSPAQSRPPVSRRRTGSIPNEFDTISVDPHGLAAVRESLTSSSSNSTVREAERSIRDKKSAKRLQPPPIPSPPPRKSSQKFGKDQEDRSSPSKKSLEAPRPSLASPNSQETVKSVRRQLVPSPMNNPPNRPSRDGTPDIQSQLFTPVPVIHSNLSMSSLPYEKRGSESNIPGSGSKSGIPASGSRNASTSRLPLGREGLSSSHMSLTTNPKRASKTELPRPTRTPSPHVGSSFNTRFPFFSRKKSSTDSSNTKDKDKKSSRKGPAAGTGHEGYGRIGAVRRRSGSATNMLRGPTSNQASQESLASNDSFLSNRRNPVVIAGGEIVENRNVSSELSRTESNLSLALSRPSVDSKVGNEGMSTSQDGSCSTLEPSNMERTTYPAAKPRRPSEESDSEGLTMKSTLAFRRSVQRLRTSPDSPLRMPQPINTSGNTASPTTSFDTSVMSDDSHSELQKEVSWGRNPAHPAPKKLVKRSRSPRKWNLFSRSQSQPGSKNEKVAATVQVVEKKPVAFYAIMDSSEQEDNEPMDVQEVLRSANVYEDSPSVGNFTGNQFSDIEAPEVPPPITSSPPRPLRLPNREVAGAPEAPQVQTSQPAFAVPGNTATRSPGRPSRLPQVGRIPKVVSNRTEQTSPKSFSRPFRASLQVPPQVQETHDALSIAKGPSPSKPSTPVPDLTMEDSTGGSGTNFSSARESVSGPTGDLSRAEKDFIAFSPRKGSEGTIGTTCSSCSAIPTFASATAIIPHPDDPLAEDEVWDEYNDLLGEDSLRAPPSATSSKGVPFQLETYQSRFNRQKPLESPTILYDNRKASIQSKATTRSSYCSADMTERIRKAFQPHPSPSDTASSFEQQIKDGDSVEKPQGSNRSSGSSRKERKSDSSSASSDDGSPLAQVNLRVGSMTVSKWLTFGHVLFSDVRHELTPDQSDKRHSILVIDGLGNDDWSFYAAETYPGATFYNLSPRAPLPAQLQNTSPSFPLSPPNHHQVQYHSHLDKFPFAPQSFTAMVYRFPVAAPESYYRNILTEARRVLKPGGYLELSILDVDLNNMGNRGRRAIRQLKESIHETMPDTNLSSTADLIVRLLGKVGFSSIKAARVGVPVSSSAGTLKRNKDTAGRAEKKKKEQPSLAEMMSDNSPMADEGITKMVGRVGRWWYTRCYESAAGSSDSKGIWGDKALLSECAELGTSLKLMVCCARAPDRVTSL